MKKTYVKNRPKIEKHYEYETGKELHECVACTASKERTVWHTIGSFYIHRKGSKKGKPWISCMDYYKKRQLKRYREKRGISDDDERLSDQKKFTSTIGQPLTLERFKLLHYFDYSLLSNDDRMRQSVLIQWKKEVTHDGHV